MKISKEVKKAMAKAEKDVRKQALKPKAKKKKRKVEKDDTELRSPSGKWFRDEWGLQGEVFFDGNKYWGVFLEPSGKPDILNAISRNWSPEKWEKRKKQENPVPSLESTETEKPLSSIPKIVKSTKSLKRVPKGKSPMKSGKTVTQPRQEKWQ